MKRFKNIMLAVVAVVSIGAAPALVTTDTVSAQTPQAELCKGSGGTFNGTTCSNATGGTKTLPQYFKTIVNVLLFLIGSIAVIMIIIGGLRYVLSGGDNSAVTSAKNTILYAVVGLIVAILAYALVNFILNAFV